MTTATRRAILGAIACTPALAVWYAPQPAAAAPAPDAVSALWEQYKAARTAWEALPDDCEYMLDKHPLGVSMDDADYGMIDAVALSPKSVAMKLRRVFMAMVSRDWADRFAMGEDTPEHREQLKLCDLYEEILWSAIDDLERMGGEA